MYDNVETISETDVAELVLITNAGTQRADYAWLTRDPERSDWVRVQWLTDDAEQYDPAACDCWAWTEQGVLWLPAEGQSNQQRDWGGILPDERDHWYDPQTGRGAVFGTPGSYMTRML